MKIHLKNFCCWEDREFTFADKGTVLISAPSGAGKTSIIRAIMFALFGSGHKIIMHGKKSCSVTLMFHDLKIYRSKGPCRLVVNDVYEDNAAQHIIHKYFQDTSFHVEQGGASSFVMLSAIDKLKFLESIIFNTIDIINIKSRLRNVIKQREDALLVLKTELNTTDIILNELEVPDEVVLPDDITFTENSIYEYEQKLEENKLLYNTIKKKIQDNDKYRLQLVDIQSTLKHTKEVIASLQMEKQTFSNNDFNIDIESKLEEKQQILQWIINNERYDRAKQEYIEQRSIYETCITDERDVLESKIQDITQNIENKSTKIYKNTIYTINNNIELYNKYIELKSEHDKLEYIDIIPLDAELSVHQTQLQQLQQTLHNLKSSYNCPKCNSILQLKDNILITMSDIIYNDKEILAKIENIKNNIIVLKKNLKDYNNINSKKKFLQQKLTDIGDLSAFNMNDALKQREQVEHDYAQLITQQKLLNEYKQNLDTINNKYNKIKERVSLLKSKCKKLKSLTRNVTDNRKDIEQDIQDLRDKLAVHIHRQEKFKQITHNLENKQRQLEKLYAQENEINQCLSNVEIDDNIDYVELKIEKYRDILNILKDYDNYFSKHILYIKYEKKCLDLESSIKHAEDLLVASMQFKEKMAEAESTSLTNLVNTINTNVQMYLDIFFEKEPLTATIKCFKQVKNNKKSQINIEIQHKGNQIDLQSLSGGERDRVILAFALTIADMSTTPMILLDECVSSLDQENANIVFDCIKSQTNKLVILVAHQIVTGMFDQIVTLSK